MEQRKMTDEKFKQADKEALDRAVNSVKKPSPWRICHGFMGDGNISVDISRTDEARPRFSIKLGKRSPEGHMLPFVPMYIDGMNIRSIRTVVDDLLAQAENWIEEQARDARIAFDLEQAKRGKPETRHTGKTQRDKDKRAGKYKEG